MDLTEPKVRTVLIIAPQFSPSSYPPANRVRLFTNHLESFGWKPLVLSVEPRFLEEEPDWEFANLISPTLEVIRSKALPFQWTRLLGIGDLGIRSFFHQWAAARKLCRRKKVELVFISGPPWYAFLIAPLIKREFGIPYVLDYIDPWVSSMGERAPFWRKAYWYRKMASWLEPFAVRGATHIVSVSDGTSECIRNRYSFFKKKPFTSMPYGSESLDFEYLRRNPKKNNFFQKTDGHFNFVYTGTMLPRADSTLRALFEAVRLLKIERPDLYAKIRFYFIGTTYVANPKDPCVLPIAREFGISEAVCEHPKRVPYLEAHFLLTQADAICALGTSEPHYTASKIYPCILANRPLLALYHKCSSVVTVVRDCNAGEIIDYDDIQPVHTKVTQIKETLMKLMCPDYSKPQTNWGHFEKYSAKNMTRELVQVLDSVTLMKVLS